MVNLRESLKSPTFGAWCSGDPLACEAMSQGGYDWLILETQHRDIAPAALLSALQAIDLGHTPALVRVGGVDQVEIMRALDIGAAGVVVPVVNNAAEARQAAQAVRYPPHGTRSYGPVRDYFRRRGLVPDPICVLMIETVEAVSNLEEIAAVADIDVLLVGPADLALSMGLEPSAALVPPILEALDHLVAVCRRYGVTAGCASFGIDSARQLVERGVDFVSVAADGAFLRRGLEEDRAAISALRHDLAANRRSRGHS